MAPERRSRRGGRSRWSRNIIRRNGDVGEETIPGNQVRKVYDSYCPFCASDIRAVGPRRLVRCPNSTLCGKPLPIDDSCCPQCTHYTKPGDNFCRVCRTNLRSVVRVRGGLFQQLVRVPSPLQNTSPPTQEPQPENPPSGEEDEVERSGDEENADVVVDVEPAPRLGRGQNPERRPNEGRRNGGIVVPGPPQAGYLRVVPIDDVE